jgi:hypothetical protein
LHVLSLETVESSLDSSSKNSVVKVFCRFLRLFVNCLYVWQKHEHFTVGDFMTRAGDLFVANIDTTVDEALEILVDKRITGMPVVDENRTLVCQFLCLQVLHLLIIVIN